MHNRFGGCSTLTRPLRHDYDWALCIGLAKLFTKQTNKVHGGEANKLNLKILFHASYWSQSGWWDAPGGLIGEWAELCQLHCPLLWLWNIEMYLIGLASVLPKQVRMQGKQINNNNNNNDNYLEYIRCLGTANRNILTIDRACPWSFLAECQNKNKKAKQPNTNPRPK